MTRKKSIIHVVFMKKKGREAPADAKDASHAAAKERVLQQFFLWCEARGHDALAIIGESYPNDAYWTRNFVQEIQLKSLSEDRRPWDELREAELLLELAKQNYHSLYDKLVHFMDRATMDMVDQLCD